MKKHVVEQGECLSSIAKAYGFSHWRIIYDDANNSAFRKKRPNPNLVYPGDQICIPDRVPRVEEGATECRHRFHTKLHKTQLIICLKDQEDKPITGQTYRLEVEQL